MLNLATKCISLLVLLFIIIFQWLYRNISGGAEYNIKAKIGTLPPPVYKVLTKACLQPTELQPDEAAARKIIYPFSRTLREDLPRLSYRSRRNRVNFALHMGQRKLLLAEIEFITKYGHMSDHIVYAGASPGTHIQELLKMYPHTFDLYDPREITWKHPRMTAHREFFTDEVAKKYAGKRVLFISDIRTDEDKDDGWDDEIIGNMDDQQTWCDIMRPAMASLKFRLSWVNKTQKYYAGTIYIQPWAPKTSTETRLFTDCSTRIDWDCHKYEEQIYTHNAIARLQPYPEVEKYLNQSNTPPGMDSCYDCCSETYILEQYLESTFYPDSEMKHKKVDSVLKFMNRISKFLKKGLNTPPHGEFPGISLTERETLYLDANPSLMCQH